MFERRGKDERQRRLIWAAAIGVSIALHCTIAIFITPGPAEEKPPEQPPKVFEVTLLPPEPAVVAPADSEEVEPYSSGEEIEAPVPKTRLAVKARPVGGAGTGEAEAGEKTGTPPIAGMIEGEGVEVPQQGGTKQGGGIDIWPSRGSLDRIAGADPRVPHIIAEREPPLVPERYVKDNLPPQIRPREIELKMDGFWNPTWDQVRDEGVTGYSTRKFGGMLKDWFASWQTAVARMGEGGYDPTKLEGLETSSTIVTLLEFLPGQDGNWTVRILKPSGYRTYDSRMLEDAEKVAMTLPPWQDGFGWVLRFKFETKFMIVPPVPSLALSFDYVPPFNPEIIYPLKKMLKKAINFEGATRLQGAK